MPLAGKRFKTARKQIEATPEIAKKEMAWYRSRPGELEDAAIKRHNKYVQTGAHCFNDWNFIHTHLRGLEKTRTQLVARRGQASISLIDIFNFLKNLDHSNIRAYTVVSIGSKGKVIGYSHFSAEDSLVKAVRDRHPEESEIYNKLAGWRWYGLPGKIKKDALPETTRVLGLLEKLGLSIRTFPMPGFKFDKKNWRFVKK